MEILKVDPLTRVGTPIEILNLFGGKQHTSLPFRTLETADSTQKASLTHMANVSNLVKTIQDIMRKDAGTYGDAQRLEQLGWMFFLKIFDDREKELELPARRLQVAAARAPSLAQLGRATTKA